MQKDRPGQRPRTDPSIGQVVLQDLREADIRGHFTRELEELYRFYLDDERRERLAAMGWFRRGALFYGWLFKSLLLKLSPARRLALLAALLLVISGSARISFPGVALSIYLWPIGVVALLVVLMLELKDKLVARDEIAIAREVQLALLPTSHPKTDGWSIWGYTRPANDVGGDLVDYLELDDRLGVALGDVAGKGLGAALLMAKLQATLRATAPDAACLATLGDRLNTILLRDGIDNRYATLFYLELAPGSGRVRYLNAGHNPPCLLRVAGLEMLPAICPPIGMLSTARFAESTLEVAAGEMLIAYSDGLTEARNGAEEEFGTARLTAIAAGLRGLDAQEAGARILAEVDAFQGGARTHDDLSLVILARTS